MRKFRVRGASAYSLLIVNLLKQPLTPTPLPAKSGEREKKNHNIPGRNNFRHLRVSSPEIMNSPSPR